MYLSAKASKHIITKNFKSLGSANACLLNALRAQQHMINKPQMSYFVVNKVNKNQRYQNLFSSRSFATNLPPY